MARNCTPNNFISGLSSLILLCSLEWKLKIYDVCLRNIKHLNKLSLLTTWKTRITYFSHSVSTYIVKCKLFLSIFCSKLNTIAFNFRIDLNDSRYLYHTSIVVTFITRWVKRKSAHKYLNRISQPRALLWPWNYGKWHFPEVLPSAMIIQGVCN